MITIRIQGMKIAIPNISAAKAKQLENHLNRIVKMTCLDILSIYTAQEIDVTNNDPVIPPHVSGWLDKEWDP